MGDRRQVPGSTLVGAAVGLVLGSAVLFAVVGMLRGDDGVTVDDDPIAAEASASPSDEPEEDASTEPSEAPSEAASEDPVEASPSPTATATAEPTSEPSESVSPPANEVDPSTITIQVLDALGGSDTSVADAVASELRDAGFNVVVVNRAGRTYDVTTVFWSPGREDAGRTVAAALGATRAEETPEEVQLSDSVAVHVVVGTDRS